MLWNEYGQVIDYTVLDGFNRASESSRIALNPRILIAAWFKLLKMGEQGSIRREAYGKAGRRLVMPLSSLQQI